MKFSLYSFYDFLFNIAKTKISRLYIIPNIQNIFGCVSDESVCWKWLNGWGCFCLVSPRSNWWTGTSQMPRLSQVFKPFPFPNPVWAKLSSPHTNSCRNLGWTLYFVSPEPIFSGEIEIFWRHIFNSLD